MLKQRHFIINYILNNQPDSIDVETDAETLSNEDAKNYIYEIRNPEQPANVTDIRVFQRVLDADPAGAKLETCDPISSETRHEES
jgi:hypothetical protein